MREPEGPLAQRLRMEPARDGPLLQLQLRCNCMIGESARDKIGWFGPSMSKTPAVAAETCWIWPSRPALSPIRLFQRGRGAPDQPTGRKEKPGGWLPFRPAKSVCAMRPAWLRRRSRLVGRLIFPAPVVGRDDRPMSVIRVRGRLRGVATALRVGSLKEPASVALHEEPPVELRRCR